MMLNRKNALKVMLGALLALAACNKNPGDAEVAVVNGRVITRAELDAFLALKRIAKDDALRRDRALDEYLEREALADEISREGGLDKTAVRAEVREFEKELVLSRYFDKLLADKVTDVAVRRYYEANADKYSEKKVHAAHILVRTNPRMSGEERRAKLTAAQEAYSKLKAGADFAEVAKALSEDRVSAPKGGDLGWLRENSIDPRFSQKVFAMKQGELSEPFETSFGFHVVKLIEPAQTVKQPFEAVQGDIRYELRAEAKKAEMDRLVAKTKIERKEKAATASKSPGALQERDKQATTNK